MPSSLKENAPVGAFSVNGLLTVIKHPERNRLNRLHHFLLLILRD